MTNVAFGDGQSASGTCADASPLHFTGQQQDNETNLDYFAARHYSHQFGRFMSPDPTGIFLGNLNDPQSLNLYSYVRNNSVNLTDPTGLRSICDWGCDDSGFDFGFGFGFGWGGGVHWDWGGGPQGSSYNPPGVGTSPNPPNGTLTSDDPFGGETNPFVLYAQDNQSGQGGGSNWWKNIWILVGLGKSAPQHLPPGTGGGIKVKGPRPPIQNNPWPEGEPPGGGPQVPDIEGPPNAAIWKTLPWWKKAVYTAGRIIGVYVDDATHIDVPIIIRPMGCVPGFYCPQPPDVYDLLQ